MKNMTLASIAVLLILLIFFLLTLALLGLSYRQQGTYFVDGEKCMERIIGAYGTEYRDCSEVIPEISEVK